MSTQTDGAESDELSSNINVLLKRWYHVPILAVVVLFMFWTRFQNYEQFQRGGDGIWLQAVDSWYHWRTTEWTVENFPWLIGYEPFTGFPEGTMPGQFGTIFDWFVASIALVLGGGSPGEQDILLAALITVPALAALVAIPTYYIGKRLSNRVGALAGVIFLALTSGEFFRRTTAGMFQHHVAEVLLMSLAVLAMMVALRVAEDERPIWELVVERNWDELRRPAIYSALAGIPLVLYIWAWPPGVVLIGIFGVYFVIQLSVDYLRGRSPDHIAFVAILSMLVVAVGTALRIQESGFSATGLDYLPPILAFLVAAGAAFMAGLARQWEQRGIERLYYPGAIGASIVGALVLMWLVLPDLYGTLVGNLSGRVMPFGYSPGALTVAEVQPPDDFSDHMFNEFGLAFYTALAGAALLIVRPLLGRTQRAEHILVVVWFVFLMSMAATQSRFSYYFVVPVAVANAHLVGFLVRGVELPDSVEAVENIESYQILTAAVVVMLLFMPLLPPVAAMTPLDAGEQTFPSGDAQKWDESNEWLSENTPELGNYGGVDNEGALDYFGNYDQPDDGSFDYPPGTYGVLSWWDYGHLITTQGERIPHSNPFQQHSTSSSAILTAQDEQQAELYLDAIAAGESISHESDEEHLRSVVEDSDGDEPGIEYVMIDDSSAAGKFFAITEWTGPDYSEYVEQTAITLGEDQQENVLTASDAYYDTMLATLYLQDAEGLEHYRLVHESSFFSLVGFDLGGQQQAQVITDDGWDEGLAENAAMAEMARAEDQLGPGELVDPHIVSTVKTFERVEGATIEGETEPGSTVTAAIELEAGTDRPFTYEQTVETDDDGNFEVTVPYPTEETLGTDDGYANSSVLMSDDIGGYSLTAMDEDGDVLEFATDIEVPEDEVQEGGLVTVTADEFQDPPEDEIPGDDEADDDENETDGEEETEDETTNES